MCDYSLCGLPTRLAAEGEDLVVHKFSTGSMGMASPADLPVIEAKPARQGLWATIRSFIEGPNDAAVVPAICIPPGAHLILKDIPADLQRRYRITAEEGVIFTQINAEVNNYRDAVRFASGCQVRLQDLRAGMRVEVLSLASVVGESGGVFAEVRL